MHYIIHCAADIRFNLPFVESLKANYIPTKGLLDLAKEAKQLKSFTYVSTAFVSSHLPKGSTVSESLFQDAISLAKRESKWTEIETQTKVLDLILKVHPAKSNVQVRVSRGSELEAVITYLCYVRNRYDGGLRAALNPTSLRASQTNGCHDLCMKIHLSNSALTTYFFPNLANGLSIGFQAYFLSSWQNQLKLFCKFDCQSCEE